MSGGHGFVSMDDAIVGDDGGVSMLPWLAILMACLCFGSFAVPMKWPSVVEAQIHPLVYQCYKTWWTFVTTHLVLFFVPYEFTWWGLLSGFSWVPAGVAAIFAVQNAGIARAQAVWQVTIIISSFIWGFAIMHDSDVYSWFGTSMALCCLVGGVVGMTVSFSLKLGTKADPDEKGQPDYGLVKADDDDDAELPQKFDSTEKFDRLPPKLRSKGSFGSLAPGSGGARTVTGSASASSHDPTSESDDVPWVPSPDLGIAAAIFTGVWGGANLVPSHYAPLGGIHFAISFATGALVANVTLVFGYFLLATFYWRCPMPFPQFRVMALPGFLSGTLWSAGNFCTLYAVHAIGQGIGYSLTQSSVIVSGLWGILYYHELQGKAIRYWAFFCGVCMVGILGLALEKK